MSVKKCPPQILDLLVNRSNVFRKLRPAYPEGRPNGGEHRRGEDGELDILLLLLDLLGLVVGGCQLKLGGDGLV